MSPTFSHVKLLAAFFVTHVLLLAADMVTDLMVGFKMLFSCERLQSCADWEFVGKATFVCIFLPCLPTSVVLFSSLIQSRCRKSKAALSEFIFGLPFGNIFKKAQYFFQLCSIDSACPHNLALVSEIHRLAISLNIYEAFLESIPQITVQVSVLVILVPLWTLKSMSNVLSGEKPISVEDELRLPIVSAAISWASCSLATINLFTLRRPAYYSDINVPFKAKLIYFPPVAAVLFCVCYLWVIMLLTIRLQYSLIILAFYIAIRFVVAMIYCWIQNQQLETKQILIDTVSSCFAPFMPWTPRKFTYFKNLLLNFFFAILPVAVVPIYDPAKYYEAIPYYVIAAFAVSFFVSCNLQWYGCYKTAYHFSKIFKLFRIRPFVHRSMIIDWLKSNKASGDESLVYPDYFEQFISDPSELNRPELDNWDTTLHFAFRESQFEALILMIDKGGNPFIRNKRGESINSLIQTLAEEQLGIKDRLREAVKKFEEAYPATDQEGAVHSAARKNQVKKLKLYKFLCATFESYNFKRQTPLEVAMECGHLEAALFLMENTRGALSKEEFNIHEPFLTTYHQNPDMRDKCLQFLASQTPESLNVYEDRYLHVFKTLRAAEAVSEEVEPLSMTKHDSIDGNDNIEINGSIEMAKLAVEILKE